MNKELTILNNWDKAKRAIALCENIDEVKKIRDQAEILRSYAKQAKMGLEIQNNVTEIKILCERRIGEFSNKLPTQIGKYQQTSHDGRFDKYSILKNAGIIHHERYETIFLLPEKKFKKYIKEIKTSNKELTSIGIIKLARELERKEMKKNLKIPPLPEGKFNVIYADPPWEYEHPISDTRKIENQYPTDSLENIINLKVKGITIQEKIFDDAILFLWCSASLIRQGLQVMEEWGFLFRTTGIWDKEKIGMGYWFRTQHEILLVGIKGKFSPPDPKDRISSVHREKPTKHSVKPEYYYNIIEKMYPNHKYFEVYQTKPRKNWTGWGGKIGRV